MEENLESIISLSKIRTAIRRTLSKKIMQYSLAALTAGFALGLTFAPSVAHAPPSWPRWADRDKDRYPVWRDCNDRDANVYPGALEECNNVDDNCDRAIDEGFDADSDGYTQCASPIPDCDDNQWSVYPSADEFCDDTDNDCDGIVDNNPVDPETWYADNDGDGYGDAGDRIDSCSSVSGYAINNNEDCDDGDASVYPNASEIFSDGIDQDCDGEDSVCDASFDLSSIIAADPLGMCYGNGSLWISDEDSFTLYEIDPANGEVINSIPASTIGSQKIHGVTYKDGYLWMVGYPDGNIYQVSTSGDIITSLGSIAGTYTHGMASNDNLWIGSGNSYNLPYEIYKVNISGSILSYFTLDWMPNDLEMIGEDLWVVNTAESQAHIFDNEGNLVDIYPLPSEISRPTAITYDGSCLWIVGNGGNLISADILEEE